jgi:hypothetical protein
MKSVDRFKRWIFDQREKMSPADQKVFEDLLRDQIFMRVLYITWIDPEACSLRQGIYDQILLVQHREHLTRLLLDEKRPLAIKILSALICDLDRCYSVDQQKLRGDKRRVRELRRIYSEKALRKLDQGIVWKDCFPWWEQEKTADEKAIHYDFHLYSKPKNKQWFQNLFDLAAVWSIQDAHANEEELILFERKKSQKDVLITVFDPDGKPLNYRGEPFSAFALERYRPLIRKVAKEYAYDRRIKEPSKEIEDGAAKVWLDLIVNYRKGKKSIPSYLKEELNRFFFGGEEVETIDYKDYALVRGQSHFIDGVIRQYVENLNFRDEIDRTIGLNYNRSLPEIQEILKGEGKKMSRPAILRRKNRMNKSLQKQLRMAKVISDLARKVPDLSEFDETDYSQA